MGAELIQGVGFRELNAVLGCLAAGAEKKNAVFIRIGGYLLQFFHQFNSFLVGEYIGGEQRLVGCSLNSFTNFPVSMTDVRNQDSGGPVDPAVAPFIVYGEIFCPVPDYRRLAHHRPGFTAAETFE